MLGQSTVSGSPGSAGWAQGRFLNNTLEDPRPDRFVEIDTPVGFGRFTFTIIPRDPNGNVATGTAAITRTIVEAPRGAGTIAFSAYDSGSDVLTLAVTHLTEGT